MEGILQDGVQPDGDEGRVYILGHGLKPRRLDINCQSESCPTDFHISSIMSYEVGVAYLYCAVSALWRPDVHVTFISPTAAFHRLRTALNSLWFYEGINCNIHTFLRFTIMFVTPHLPYLSTNPLSKQPLWTPRPLEGMAFFWVCSSIHHEYQPIPSNP